MQHARSAAGQQKHIIIGDAAVFHGIGMQTRVAVIDAVDIRINAAEIGVQEGRQRDRRRIGTAASFLPLLKDAHNPFANQVARNIASNLLAILIFTDSLVYL